MRFLLPRACFLLTILGLLVAWSPGQADDDKLKKTLPPEGELKDGKPVGDGWVPLFEGNELKGWKAEPEYWSLKDGVLHGEYKGGPQHHFSYTEKEYADFELHCMVKMTGMDANSGVCIRIKPANFDKVPGYQVDMGDGFWGCLWDEGRDGMVQQFPKDLANKLVNKDDWNHYYVIASGHHIEAWLNGVKTIDKVHENGFLTGPIGFQLCHGKKTTIVDFKSMYIKEMKKE
jgi:hypothetical protein